MIPGAPQTRRSSRLVLLVASTLSIQAAAIMTPALPHLADHFGAHPDAALLTRLVLTLPMLAIAVISPLAGWVVDRHGRTRVLQGSVILYSLAGASGLVIDDIETLLFSRIMVGIAVAGIATSTTTLIGDYYDGETRTRLLGQQWSMMALASIVLLTLGGILGEMHWRTPFALYGLGLLLLPAIVRSLPEPVRRAELDRDQAFGRSGFWMTALLGYGLATTSMIAFYMIPSQIPFRLAELGEPSPTIAGLAVAVLNVVAAPVAIAHRRLRDRIGPAFIFAITYAGLALGYVLVAKATGATAIFAAMLLAGIAAGGMMLNITVWVVGRTPAAIRGRVVGGLSMSMFLGQFLSPLYSQPVAERIGLGSTFGVTAAVVACVAIIFLAIGLLRRRPSP